MRRSAQWHDAELLPAYSGGTVMDLHHLPRHRHRFSKTPFPENERSPIGFNSRAGDMALAAMFFKSYASIPGSIAVCLFVSANIPSGVHVQAAESGRQRCHAAEIPVERQDRRPIRCMGQKSVPIFDDKTRGFRKLERLFGSRPVTDNQREACFTTPILPLSIRTMNTRSPGGRRDQQLRAVESQNPGNVRRIGVAADQQTGLDPIAVDRRCIVAWAGP